MDRTSNPHAADVPTRLDPGPFLRQEGRPPRLGAREGTPDGAVPARRYPRAAIRTSRVPAWIGWVARRITTVG